MYQQCSKHKDSSNGTQNVCIGSKRCTRRWKERLRRSVEDKSEREGYVLTLRFPYHVYSDICSIHSHKLNRYVNGLAVFKIQRQLQRHMPASMFM